MSWSGYQTASSSSSPGYTSGSSIIERPNNRISKITSRMTELSKASTTPPGLRNLAFPGQPENYDTGNPMNPGVIPENMRQRRAGTPKALPSVMSSSVLKTESYFNGRSGNKPMVNVNIEAMVMLDNSHLQFTIPGHITMAMAGEGEVYRSVTQNRQLTLIRSLEQFNMDIEAYFAKGLKVLTDALRNGTGIGSISYAKLQSLMRNDTSVWYYDEDFKQVVESNNKKHRMLGYLSLEFIAQKWNMIGISAGQLTAGLAGMSCDVAICASGEQEGVINVWGSKVRPLDTVGFILKFVNTYADVGKGEERLAGVSSPKLIPWHGSSAGPQPQEYSCIDATGNVNNSAVFLRLGKVLHFSIGSKRVPPSQFNYAAQAGLIPRPQPSNPINPIVEHKMTISINLGIFF